MRATVVDPGVGLRVSRRALAAYGYVQTDSGGPYRIGTR